ncbi:hypothetical protein SHIRM173S_00521 [Streptomyces hirsutus]
MEVHNPGCPESVCLRRPDADDAHGRGLLLVDSIAASWHSGPSRFGGTVVSFVMADAQYAEAGAMRLPDFHPLVLALVDKLGLGRRQFYNVDVDPSTGSSRRPRPAGDVHLLHRPDLDPRRRQSRLP